MYPVPLGVKLIYVSLKVPVGRERQGAHELGPLRDAERWAPGGPVFACQVWALLHVPEPREGKPASLRRTTGIMMGSAPGEAGSS